MLKKVLFFILTIFVFSKVNSQSFYFGIKGGPTFAYQKWESFNQSPLLTYNVLGFVESYSEDNPLNCLYSQLGFLNKGSAWRGATAVTYSGNLYRIPTKKFVFSNLSLGVGGKRKQILTDRIKSFYSFGLRAEYNLFTNLDKFVKLNKTYNYYFPDNGFVNKFTYGVTVGGGVEFSFSELFEGSIEITVNPDISNQYDQPQISGVVSPYNPENTITLRRRRIKNTTIEISFGLRFMNRVKYVD